MITGYDRREVVEVANRVRRKLTGDFKQVRDLVEQHDLVIAVWQDVEAPDFVGTMIVKGEQVLRPIVEANRARELSWTAIPCICAEQAEALRQVAGEQDWRH